MADRALDDVRQLPRAGQDALRGALEPGERVQVVVPGLLGTGLVATDYRCGIWKGGAWRWWSLAEVDRATVERSLLISYVALKGPAIPRRKLRLGRVGPARHAVQVDGKAVLPAVDALNALLSKRDDVPATAEAGEGQVELDESPAAPHPAPDITDQLRKLGELRDLGIVTEEEFTAKKTELLSRL